MSNVSNRFDAQKKLSLAMQRLLSSPTDSAGKPLLGAEFAQGYEHNRRTSIINKPEFQAALKKLHADNPHNDVPYGRGRFTYIPISLALQIDDLHGEFGLDRAGAQYAGKGWSYAVLELKEGDPATLPASTEHTKFTQYVQTEAPYATAEESTKMTLLLAQMAADLEAQDAKAAADLD